LFQRAGGVVVAASEGFSTFCPVNAQLSRRRMQGKRRARLRTFGVSVLGRRDSSAA
jgi:hypothetical protein